MKIMFNNFIRKKNFYIYLLIITACIVFLTLTITMFYSVFNIVSKKNNDIKNRQLIISTYDNYEVVYQRLNKINGVYGIYNFVHEINGTLTIQDKFNIKINSSVLNSVENIILGKDFDKNDKNSVILPSKLMINNQEVSLQEFLNKNITLSINIGDKTIDYFGTVIGIYDESDNKRNVLYIPYDDLVEILYSDMDEIEKINAYIIISEENYNIEKLINEIKSTGYDATIYDVNSQKEVRILNTITDLFFVMIIIIIFIIYIVFKTIIGNLISDDEKDISIMKSIGYSNLKLLYIYLFNIFILINISFLISLPIIKTIIHLILPLIINKKIATINIIEPSIISLISELIIIFIVAFVLRFNIKRKIKNISFLFCNFNRTTYL